MNFEPISKGRQIFKDISFLYFLFKEQPYNGLDVLSDSPYTQERIVKTRDENDPRWKHWLNRENDELPIPPSYAYAHYKFSGDDVREYLIERVYNLDTDLLRQIQEISKSEVVDRLFFYVDYRKELETVNKRLSTFANVPTDEHGNKLQPEIPRLNKVSDWQSIYASLHSFLPDIQYTTAAYIKAISRYLPEEGPNKDDSLHEQPQLTKRVDQKTSSQPEDFVGEITALLHNCYSNIFDITRDWSTDDLGQLSQGEWDASKPTFEAMAGKLGITVCELQKLTQPTLFKQKVNYLMRQASLYPDQKVYILSSLNLLFGETQSVREQVIRYTGRSGSTGREPAKIDERFQNAIYDIDNASSTVFYCLRDILDPLPIHETKPIASDLEAINQQQLITNLIGFEDLFYNQNDIKVCVEALRNYRNEKPLINSDNRWLGGRKDRGILVAWVERMEGARRQIIKRVSNRKHLVRLLNEYFKDLNMGRDARVFDNVPPQELRDAFSSLMPGD